MSIAVSVHGYTRRLNVIAFVKLIRKATGESLAPAKGRVDNLLAGEPFEIVFPDDETAASFHEAATALGAVATRSGNP